MVSSASATRRWSRRRRASVVAAYATSRILSWLKSYAPSPCSRTSWRRRSSSIPATRRSSSPTPLARMTSKVNARPIVAASDARSRAGSDRCPRRASMIAWTRGGRRRAPATRHWAGPAVGFVSSRGTSGRAGSPRAASGRSMVCPAPPELQSPRSTSSARTVSTTNSGLPSVSTWIRSAWSARSRRPAVDSASADVAAASRGPSTISVSCPSSRSPSSRSPARSPASGWPRSTSSGRTVPTRSTAACRSDRSRKWSHSSVPGSHHWRSSRTSRSGRSAAWTAFARA